MRLHNILKIDFDRNRIYGLDILRALAILFVVIGHGSHYLPTEALQTFSNFIALDGVSIFFVLSGYLIGGILIKILENTPPTMRTLIHFWERRWFRTLPNYYFILLLLIILNTVFKDKMGHPFEGGFPVYKYYFLFLQNFSTPHPVFFQEAWSLCIEEWFYLLIPPMIFFCVGVLRFTPKRSVLLIALTVIVFVTCFRYFRFTTSPNSILEWEGYYRKQVITRLDSIMFGLIGAFFSVYYKDLWTRHKKAFFIAGVLLLFAQNYFPEFFLMTSPGYLCIFSFTITSIGTILLIPFLSEYKNGDGVVYKALTYISLISYSMYLINLTLVQLYLVNFIDKYVTHTGFVLYVSYWAFTVIGSILLYKYLEKPLMDLRNRLK
jgi:peptidoglycan/LPS O-acetylase OafA/YrhL